MLDAIIVEQCAIRPPGMQTIEFIPNSLREEWTEAWNSVHRLWQAAITVEEKERAMKWIVGLPQGPLHPPQRGGSKGNRQYRELARRFVRWRQGDKLAIVMTWKMAAVVADQRRSKPGARKAKGD